MMYGIKKWDGVREAAFLEGNVEICEWVCAHGTFEQDMRTWVLQTTHDYSASHNLVVMGRLEMLQWYMARLEVENLPDIVNHKKNNCIYVKRAAEYGHLEMLKWMVENGFKFAADALTAAAERGQLECVVYLRDRGCKITPTVSKATVNIAQIHVLRWVIENGCKWNPQWTLDQLEQIDSPHGTKVGAYHAATLNTAPSTRTSAKISSGSSSARTSKSPTTSSPLRRSSAAKMRRSAARLRNAKPPERARAHPRHDCFTGYI